MILHSRLIRQSPVRGYVWVVALTNEPLTATGPNTSLARCCGFLSYTPGRALPSYTTLFLVSTITLSCTAYILDLSYYLGVSLNTQGLPLRPPSSSALIVISRQVLSSQTCHSVSFAPQRRARFLHLKRFWKRRRSTPLQRLSARRYRPRRRTFVTQRSIVPNSPHTTLACLSRTKLANP